MNDTANSVTDALQPVAWIRKNGIRFNVEVTGKPPCGAAGAR